MGSSIWEVIFKGERDTAKSEKEEVPHGEEKDLSTFKHTKKVHVEKKRKNKTKELLREEEREEFLEIVRLYSRKLFPR